MNLINISRNKEAFYGSLGSLAVHLIVLISIILLLKSGGEAYSSQGGKYYVDITSVKGSLPSMQAAKDNAQIPQPEKVSSDGEERPQNISDQKKSAPESKRIYKAATGLDSKKESETAAGTVSSQGSEFRNIESAGFDSSALGQYYKEPTLNVRMKYPEGWVYIDQQRKRKLDGITFWASGSNFNPPPYIHVEVVDKYIFNPDQYKFRYDFEKFTGYYNEPVELENQISQVIYLRTEDEEDYTIKLIMENKDAFRQFQPVFFAIVKSFKFGSAFF